MPADVPSGEYFLPRSDRVLFGAGSLGKLPAALAALGAGSALVVTGRTLSQQTPLVQQLCDALGRHCAGVFADAQAHVPAETVTEAARLARRHNADALISFGGGSPIDTAKAVAALLAIDAEDAEQLCSYYVSFSFPEDLREPQLPDRVLPHIAIPTTLSAGEFTPLAGVTDQEARRKRILKAPALTPRMVLLDPELTLETPMWLWTSTGIRAVDHAVEALYGRNRHPISDALALAAMESLTANLRATRERPYDLAVRMHLQLAVAMGIWAMLAAGSGLSHGIGYGLGARFGVPHGISSCVALPHVMSFNLPVTIESQARLARRLGWATEDAAEETAAAAAAAGVDALIAELGHPRCLRDVGISEADIPQLAADTMAQPNVVSNPRQIRDQRELEVLLTSML